MDNKEMIAWLKIILLMIGVIALGVTAVNQTLGFYYKAQLLVKPCDLCTHLNPNFCGFKIINNYGVINLTNITNITNAPS